MVCLHYRGFVGWLKYSFPFLPKWLKYSLPFTLPAKYSEVILLHFWQHMSLTEIAAILNTSLSTVSRRLTDAKKRLRKQLEEGNL